MENQPMTVDNFLTTINFTENIDELTEIKLKIDEEIAKTRAKDKGGDDGMDRIGDQLYHHSIYFIFYIIFPRSWNQITTIKLILFEKANRTKYK